MDTPLSPESLVFKGSLFVGDGTQAVRLPAGTRFPDEVKHVLVRVVGQDRVVARCGVVGLVHSCRMPVRPELDTARRKSALDPIACPRPGSTVLTRQHGLDPAAPCSRAISAPQGDVHPRSKVGDAGARAGEHGLCGPRSSDELTKLARSWRELWTREGVEVPGAVAIDTGRIDSNQAVLGQLIGDPEPDCEADALPGSDLFQCGRVALEDALSGFGHAE